MLPLCSTSTSWSRLLSSMKIWSSSSGVTTCLTSECRIRRHCFAVSPISMTWLHARLITTPEGFRTPCMLLSASMAEKLLWQRICTIISTITYVGMIQRYMKSQQRDFKSTLTSNSTQLEFQSASTHPLRPSPKLSHYGLSLRHTQPPHKAAAALL